MLNGSKTVLGMWRSCRTEGPYSEHSRGEEGTSGMCFCSVVPLLLLCGRILRKLWLGGDLDLMLWWWPCGDE